MHTHIKLHGYFVKYAHGATLACAMGMACAGAARAHARARTQIMHVYTIVRTRYSTNDHVINAYARVRRARVRAARARVRMPMHALRMHGRSTAVLHLARQV